VYSDEDLTPAQVAVLGVLAPLWREPIKYQIPIFRYVDMPTTDEGMFELVDQLVAAVRDAEKPPVADGWYRFSCGTCGTTEVSVTSPVGRTTWQVTCLNGHPVVSGSYETSVVDPQRLYVSKPPPAAPADWTAADGWANASDEFERVRAAVERIIRTDAGSLIAGHADQTARLVVATLAHRYGMAPTGDRLSANGPTAASAEGDNGADGPAPMETM
jgi:hypothetical protein